MKTRHIIAAAGFATILSTASVAAWAKPPSCPGCGHGHHAPAPLLAAGIPAFALLGGGTAVRWVRRKARRS